MANSKLPPPNKNTLVETVIECLQQAFEEGNNPTPKLLLAYSGGLDSSVLLRLLVHAQQAISFQLSVMHVHHGLSPNADAWRDFCAASCQKLDVPFESVAVRVDTAQGLGVEAAARQARYQALQAVDADWIVLGHHQNDQAETVLLQLARGAGVKGLSAMPAIDAQQKRLRPLLNISRETLEAYAREQDIAWVEDESNQSLTFDRNIIRHEVLPVLQQQYPAVVQNLSRSAQHCAEAQSLLTDLAVIDAAQVMRSENAGEQKLNLVAYRQLAQARAKNVLRYWFDSAGLQMPSTHALVEIHHQLSNAKLDATIDVNINTTHHVRTYQGEATIQALVDIQPYAFVWQGESRLKLADGLYLDFEESVGVGLSYQKLKAHSVRIQSRQGGERLYMGENRPKQQAKQLFQSANIPVWERSHYPMIYSGETVVCIPEIANDYQYQAKVDELSIIIRLRQE